MNTKMKIAFGCYAAVQLLFVGFALTYLLRPQFMPYHAEAVGMPWEQVGPPFQVLIIGLMRVFGGALLANAFIGAVLLLVPFRQGATWVRWAIPAQNLIAACSSLYGTLYVAMNTPARSPWMFAAAAIVLTVAGALMTPNQAPARTASS